MANIVCFVLGLQASRATDATDWGYWGENGNYD